MTGAESQHHVRGDGLHYVHIAGELLVLLLRQGTCKLNQPVKKQRRDTQGSREGERENLSYRISGFSPQFRASAMRTELESLVQTELSRL